MQLIDTHAHLTDPSLMCQLDDVLKRARQAGVAKIVCVGTTATTSREAIELASKYHEISPSVGIHPNYAHQASQDDWKTIQQLAREPSVVALGETGLDRYWDDCPWVVQLGNFRRHWELSNELQLPVIVHSRDCDDEMVEQLRITAGNGKLSGIMHAFSGSLPMAESCLELGLHISFAGMVTYKKSSELRAVAERVPIDRILVETDAPYLSPEPKRAVRPNEPSLVLHTAECIARCHGISLAEVASITTANASRLFGWKLV